MKNERETGHVLAVKYETEDIKSVYVKMDAHSELLKHKPGQYATLALHENGSWTAGRPFTLTNAPQSEALCFTIKNVDSFTNKFHALQPGDTVGVKGPLGSFCSTVEAAKSVVLVAGGLGITPFLSVLRCYAKKTGLKRTTLFWGNKTGDSFFSLDELDAFHFFMDFEAVVVAEKPFQPRHLRHHRISTLNFAEGLLTAELMKRYVDFRGCRVLVCGSGTMQLFIRNQLKQCGVDDGCIETEKFGV